MDTAAADVITYLQQTTLLPKEAKALIDPVPPGTPGWAEVELRVTSALAVDPDACCYPAGKGVTAGHALRMASAAHTRHVLVNRAPESGVSCYIMYAPVNPQELLDDPQAVPDMSKTAAFGLTLTTAPPGYAMAVELSAGDTDVTHHVTGPTVQAVTHAALSWIYQGYPLTPGRPGVHRDTSPVGAVQQPVPDTPAAPSRIRYAAGWVTRFVLAYAVMGVYVMAALSAGAHAWLHGLYAEELQAILRGMLLGAVAGTAVKYTGIWLMRGTPGAAEEAGR